MSSIRLLAGAVLAIPALLVTVVMAPLLALLSLPAAWCLLAHKPKKTAASSASTNSNKKRVIVTGGSSGIGLAVAIAAAQHEGVTHIAIVARNEERLAAAKKLIQQQAAAANTAKITVTTHSVDVTDAAAVEMAMASIMNQSTTQSKTTTHLFCCAGEPRPAHFRDNTAADYAHICRTNQLGSISTAQSVLNKMQAGTITFCSSMCGQIGVFGYSAYAPTKFALRGYAECLSVELCNHPAIHVQVAYPPDTDTPGYAMENETKPRECALISEMAGLADPAVIGARLWKEAALVKTPRFHVYFNLDGWLLCHETCGFAPVTTLSDAVAQLSLLILARWVSLFYLAEWHRLIRNFQNSTSSGKEEEEEKETGATTATSNSSNNSSSVKQD